MIHELADAIAGGHSGTESKNRFDALLSRFEDATLKRDSARLKYPLNIVRGAAPVDQRICDRGLEVEVYPTRILGSDTSITLNATNASDFCGSEFACTNTNTKNMDEQGNLVKTAVCVQQVNYRTENRGVYHDSEARGRNYNRFKEEDPPLRIVCRYQRKGGDDMRNFVKSFGTVSQHTVDGPRCPAV